MQGYDVTREVTNAFANRIAFDLARAGRGWAAARAQAAHAGENAPPEHGISGPGEHGPPSAAQPSTPCLPKLCEHFENLFALNLVTALVSLVDACTPRTLAQAAPGTDSAGTGAEGGYTVGEPHPATLRGSGEFGDPLRIEPHDSAPVAPSLADFGRTASLPPDVVDELRARVAPAADTPFAIVVNLLREAVRLAVVGDITPGMDDGIGWGRWMTDAEDTLARLKHVPELAPINMRPMKPSDFRKGRAEFGQNDAADAMAYALAAPTKPGLVHKHATDTAPPPGAEPDDAPLMVACDSEYRAASRGDEHDWCNRTFVARIGDTIVASLNVQGYDDDAFDLARCAAAAWEAPHKSWGPHKADDLLARTADQRTVDAATYLSRRLVQVLALLQPEVVPSDVVGAREIIREVANRLATFGEASSFDADRQQYIDVGGGTLYVGDAAYWRGKLADAQDAPELRETYLRLTRQVEHQRQEIGKLHARLGTQDNGAWVSKSMYDECTATLAEVRGLLEKAREDNNDCKTYMVEVFHDALRWLEGKMERVPEPDYGVRMEGAKRELNCALAAMGNPISANRHVGMHHAASHLLWGMGWGWRAHEGFWQPGPKASKVFRDSAEIEQLELEAGRFERLAGACRIDGQQDYGRVVHVLVTRGSDEANSFVNYAKQPASLAELADQIKAGVGGK